MYRFSYCFLLWIFCVLFTTSSVAQGISSKEELKSMTFGQRLYYGGILGAGFGTITNIQVMPVVGYRILPRWNAGIGANYQFFQDNRVPSYNTHIYGGNAHTRVFILDNLFAHSELEIINLEVPNFADQTLKRETVPHLFVGAGYFMRAGARSGLAVTFLYDIIQDVNSPYPANYTLRIGFVF